MLFSIGRIQRQDTDEPMTVQQLEQMVLELDVLTIDDLDEVLFHLLLKPYPTLQAQNG